MLNCLFYSLFFVLFVSVSTGSLRLSQVNRIFMSSYKGMYEASVITVGSDGEPIYPYFSQPVLKDYINEYLVKNLNRYATNYTLGITFYQKDGVTICKQNDLARKVSLQLNAKINYLFSYDKEQVFSIKEKDIL